MSEILLDFTRFKLLSTGFLKETGFDKNKSVIFYKYKSITKIEHYEKNNYVSIVHAIAIRLNENEDDIELVCCSEYEKMLELFTKIEADWLANIDKPDLTKVLGNIESQLEKMNNHLEALVYAPGNSEYQEAKEHFKQETSCL